MGLEWWRNSLKDDVILWHKKYTLPFIYLKSNDHSLSAFTIVRSSPRASDALAVCIHSSYAALCASFAASHTSFGTHPSEFVVKDCLSHILSFCTASKSSYCRLCSLISLSDGEYGQEPCIPNSFQRAESSISSCRTAAALSLHDVWQ